MTKSAIIFLNGEPTDATHLGEYLDNGALLIGTDGGTRHILNLGLVPNVIIGDFDSLPRSTVIGALPPNGQETVIDGTAYVRYPLDKDYTDAELAIRYAAQAGCTDIILTGALGGRLDHLLGNVLLLSKREFAAIQLKIIEDDQEVFIIRGHTSVPGKKDDAISFIPITGYPRVASCSGLKYDLSNYRLSRQGNLGISNVMLGPTAEIVMAQGLLLVIHQL